MSAPKSSTILVYALIAFCLVLLAPYLGIHLLVTEAPEHGDQSAEPAEYPLNKGAPHTEFAETSSKKRAGGLTDIEQLLER